MQSWSTDVLVVGGGAAGLTAAITAAQQGVQVCLLAKGPLGKVCSTVLSGGGLAGPDHGDSEEDFITLVRRIGQGLNDPPLLEALAAGAPRAYEFLRDCGMTLQGKLASSYQIKTPVRPRGKVLSEKLAAKVGALAGISPRPYHTVTALVRDENGRCAGCAGFTPQGDPFQVMAKATILAAGGGAGLFSQSSTARAICGDGFALAARVGVQLRDMEFTQFYPITFLGSKRTLPLPLPEAFRLVDSSGKDILRQAVGDAVSLDQAARQFRDALSKAIVSSQRAGRPVYLDHNSVPDEAWAGYPNLRQLSQFLRDNPASLPEITPLTHFSVGGVVIDPRCRTSLPGLWAAGEVTGGLHGANRLGGNGLTECFVFGLAAGESAAQESCQPDILGRIPGVAAKDVLQPSVPAGVLPRRMLAGLRELAWSSLGPLRDGKSMAELDAYLEKAQEETTLLEANDPQELRAGWELKNSVTTLRLMTLAALERRESRGCHQRTDFSASDPQYARISLRLVLVNAQGSREEIRLVREHV